MNLSWLSYSLVLILSLHLVSSSSTHSARSGFAESTAQRSVRIAIIGGGMGGSGASWFLRERLENDAEIVIFNDAASLGGRVDLVDIDGHSYEAGASIFHAKNQLIMRFAKLFGMEILSATDGERFAIFNATKPLVKFSGWKVVDTIHALWRYGYSPVKLSGWVDKKVDQLSNIYRLFERNCSFLRPVDLVLAADPSAQRLLKSTLKDVMREDGFSRAFIEEIAGTAMRVNYNQGMDVPAYVGSISLAGMDGPLHRIRGGNRQIVEKLAESATKIVFNKVVSITAMNTTEFQILTEQGQVSTFDYVILAAPLHHNSTPINFIGFPDYFKPQDWIGGYRRTVATFVKGRLNASYFGRDLDSVYNINLGESIASISKLTDVLSESVDPPVWKIFSSDTVPHARLKQMFNEMKTVVERDWLAYPDYLQAPRKRPPFAMYGNLLYLNAIEWMGSAMEMSLIAAHNIATLIENRICGRTPDCPEFSSEARNEL